MLIRVEETEIDRLRAIGRDYEVADAFRASAGHLHRAIAQAHRDAVEIDAIRQAHARRARMRDAGHGA